MLLLVEVSGNKKSLFDIHQSTVSTFKHLKFLFIFIFESFRTSSFGCDVDRVTKNSVMNMNIIFIKSTTVGFITSTGIILIITSINYKFNYFYNWIDN